MGIVGRGNGTSKGSEAGNSTAALEYRAPLSWYLCYWDLAHGGLLLESPGSCPEQELNKKYSKGGKVLHLLKFANRTERILWSGPLKERWRLTATVSCRPHSDIRPGHPPRALWMTWQRTEDSILWWARCWASGMCADLHSGRVMGSCPTHWPHPNLPHL